MQLYKSLERLLDNQALNISRETYLEIIAQTGEEYDENRAPPDIAELPVEVQIAFQLYQHLPSIVGGMGGYIGKDWASLPMLFELYKVPDEGRKDTFEILSWLDNKNIQQINKQQKQNSKRKN